MPINKQISADTIVRYLPLIRYLERGKGYGTYIISVHGKRPVKIAEITRFVVIETEEDLQGC
ncbi:MAG: hypothetical protein WC455_24835 [Dehalococcoidia bacterium]|jgi:hypothetical protein